MGGFLAYDGFSKVEVDVSKPSVDYTTVSHSEWVQISGSQENFKYELRSGISLNNVEGGATGDYTKYEIEDDRYQVEPNLLYNDGNVDLQNIAIEVRYKYNDNTYIGSDGSHITTEGYHVAETKASQSSATEQVINAKYENISLKKGEALSWQDIWDYTTVLTDHPNGNGRMPYVGDQEHYDDGTTGLNLGKDSSVLMDIRIKLEKDQQYKPIYETRNKSDIEGVAGIMIGLTGIYFIVDHFVDMRKFNAYVRRHNLNLKIATASNEYKLMLQKRI